MVIVELLILLSGLGLLLVASHYMVAGASAVATLWRISPMIVGMVIVGFGTSAAELAVNLSAVWRGAADVAFGNIVGSNIGNIGLILGLTALLRPLTVHQTIVTREVPMMLLATLVTGLLMADRLLDGSQTTAGVLTRADGLVLLMLFDVFMYYTFASAFGPRDDDAFVTEAVAVAVPGVAMGRGRAWVYTLAGLAGVLIGGQLTVWGAVDVATRLGFSSVVIGLTIVAIGTSLPELATSITAALRGQSDLAVGNIVGSNIFNLLFILGLTAVFRPVAMPEGGMVDLMVMLVFAAVLLPLALTHQRRIVRAEGAGLLLAYGGYVVWLIVRG